MRNKNAKNKFKQVFQKEFTALFTVMALLFSASAFAAPKVSIEITAEKDIVSIDEKGKETTTRVTAETTLPGDILLYTINYKNSGDESAINVEVNNPIVKGTIYQKGSAWGDGSKILFSAEGAEETFKSAKDLSVKTKNAAGKIDEKTALPEHYRAIRWVIGEIPAASEGKVGFSVAVE